MRNLIVKIAKVIAMTGVLIMVSGTGAFGLPERVIGETDSVIWALANPTTKEDMIIATESTIKIDGEEKMVLCFEKGSNINVAIEQDIKEEIVRNRNKKYNLNMRYGKRVAVKAKLIKDIFAKIVNNDEIILATRVVRKNTQVALVADFDFPEKRLAKIDKKPIRVDKKALHTWTPKTPGYLSSWVAHTWANMLLHIF